MNATRRANAARLRSDFADEPHWRALAAAAGAKLPPYGVPVAAAALERWLRALGVSVPEYLESFGRLGEPPARGEGPLPTLAQVARHYDAQAWPLKAVVGLMLECQGRAEGPPEPRGPELAPVVCSKCGRRLGEFAPGFEVLHAPCQRMMRARRQAFVSE